MEQLDLLFVPFTSINLNSVKINKLLLYVCNKMSNECGGDTPNKILNSCRSYNSCGDDTYGNSCGMFFLVSDTKVVSTVMLEGHSKIAFIWTPPRCRKMGYATKLLIAISKNWEKYTKVAPLWVCADKIAASVCKKAGYVCDGTINHDGTEDYIPKDLFDRYMNKLKDKISKGMATISLDDANDFIVYFETWKNANVRKKLIKCRI